MKSLSSVGLALSVVFTCLLFALVAEIYYLLWWKRRRSLIRRQIIEDESRNSSYMLCCKNQASCAVNISSSAAASNQVHTQEFYCDPYNSNNKDLLHHKPFDDSDQNRGNADLVISGPPRFLFTINEETNEDMACSEDGRIVVAREKSRKSLNELMKNMDIITSPYVTPCSSPPLFLTPCSSTTPVSSTHSGYNPFNECSNDAEFSKIVKSSPPPKFKFLRDAEDKLHRKNLFEQVIREKSLSKMKNNEGQDGNFIAIIVANNMEIDMPNHHYHSPFQCHSSFPSSSSSSSYASQVFPLAK